MPDKLMSLLGRKMRLCKCSYIKAQKRKLSPGKQLGSVLVCEL